MARGVGITTAQRDSIRRLAQGGMSTREIAARVGLPRTTVREHRRILGLVDASAPRAVTATDRDAIVTLARSGKDVRAIVAATGLGRATVWKHLRQMRIAVKHPPRQQRRRSAFPVPRTVDQPANAVGSRERTCGICQHAVVTVPDAKGEALEVLREVRTLLLLDGTVARGRWVHREVCLLHQIKIGLLRQEQALP